MSPRVGPLEIPAPKRPDARRDPTDPPVEQDLETKSNAAQVAEFRSSKYTVSLPAMVLCALITAFSGALVAWINKPPTVAASLTPEQADSLSRCGKLADDVAEIKAWTRWAEPQIGILLVRTDSRTYTAPPRAP